MGKTNDVFIRKISVEADGRISVELIGAVYENIFRSGKQGVCWNYEKNCLQPFRLGDVWGVVQWYQHIVLAVEDEYGETLKLNDETVFENVDDDIKKMIIDLSQAR